MAKYCAICNKKMGMLSPKYSTQDGMICNDCWKSLGLQPDPKTILKASLLTVNELKKLGLSSGNQSMSVQPPPPSPETLVSTIPPKNISKKKRKRETSEEIHEALMSTPSNPIDIHIEVSADDEYTISCQGAPLFTFEDMVAGNEMIIGKGYVDNKSNHDLLEIELDCEFDPPIVSSGTLSFSEGLFRAGEAGEFDIEDPPVVLDEYAKVGVLTAGTVKIVLKLAGQIVGEFINTMTVVPAPRKELENLIGAVSYQTAKESDGPCEILLSANKNGTFEIDTLRNPQLLYSMYSNNQEQIIGDVHVINDTSKQLRNLKFEAKFSSDILAPMSILLGNVNPGEAINFEVDDPAIDVEKLAAITDIETCMATYSMYVGSKKVAETTGKITICPYDQWNAALVMLPAYMTPNHPYIIKVLQKASGIMSEKGKNPSLEGYQGDSNRVKEMVEAVYDSLKAESIVYSNPPASFFGPQRIRLCTDVLENKFATCLDITLLFASCLESFGLNPLLITAPSHIFAGVWLGDQDHLEDPIISDAKALQGLIESGKVIALECTCMSAGKGDSFEDAIRSSNELIQAMVDNDITSHECVDVQIVRAMGVRPLPLRIDRSIPGATDKGIKPSDRIEDSSERSAKKASKADSKKSKKPDRDKNIGTYTTEPYFHSQVSMPGINSDNLYDKKMRPILKEIAAQIINEEGPISQPLLIDAIVKAIGISRATSKVSAYLEEIIMSAGVKITRQNGVRIFWAKTIDPNEYLVFRTEPQRVLDNMSKHEAKNAVCYILEENGPMPKEDLIKALIRLFGYTRSSSKIDAAASWAIRSARELKEVVQLDDGDFALAD